MMQFGGQSDAKIIMMGRYNSGKTSMRSIIFANFHAKDTNKIAMTIGQDKTKLKLLGKLPVTLWDCGGQPKLMEQYFNTKKEIIFKNVEILIFLFDVTTKELDKDLSNYDNAIKSIIELSKDAKIFVFINKMDLIDESKRKSEFEIFKEKVIARSQNCNVECIGTSIWDETLYKAWSKIVKVAVPNLIQIENSISFLLKSCNADEVILLEKETYLEICHVEEKKFDDIYRFEKISNIIKKFKLSTSIVFKSLFMRNINFSIYITEFTPSVNLMIIISDPAITEGLIQINVEAAKEAFTKIMGDNSK